MSQGGGCRDAARIGGTTMPEMVGELKGGSAAPNGHEPRLKLLFMKHL